MKKITLLFFALFLGLSAQAQIFLQEGFETSVPPAGWIDQVGSGLDEGNLWASDGAVVNSGAAAAKFDDFDADNDRWLISPVMDLSGATTPELSYYDHVNFSSFAAVQDVLYSTDYTGSGDPTIATWTSVNAVIGTEDTWVLNGPYTLPVNATVYVAFHYNGNFAAEWWIDDVLVQEQPLCTPPVATLTIVDNCGAGTFTIDVDVTSLGDATSVTIANDAGVTNTQVMATGIANVGPFSVEDLVAITLEHDQDPVCNVNLGNVSSDCPPNCATTPTPADDAIDVDITESNNGLITLTWTAPATGVPPADYTIMFGTTSGALNDLGETTDTTININNVDFGTEYFWMIVPNNAAGTPATGCAEWSFTTEAAPAITNDEPAGAIMLTTGAVFTSNPLTGSNVGATPSETLDPTIPAPGCAGYDPVDPTGKGGDVWYAVTVPSDGNLTIETNASPTGGGGDGGMAVYTGSVGAFALFECDDDASDDGAFELVLIETADALANQTVYVRLWEFGGDANLFFQVSAYSATLSNENFEAVNELRYFPNPADNTLSLRAKNEIQNVTVFNMLGQQVMTKALNTVSEDLDISALGSGAYFVKVTINNTTETIRVVKK